MNLLYKKSMASCRSVCFNPSILYRLFSITHNRQGIEEFFPPGVYDSDKLVEENPTIGRQWKVAELRIKSNSDLHKLWYVLLKEKNMILTMRQEAKRLGIPVPGPTRLHKVTKSMNTINSVIKNRHAAILELEKEKRYKFDGPKIYTNHFNDNEPGKETVKITSSTSS